MEAILHSCPFCDFSAEIKKTIDLYADNPHLFVQDRSRKFVIHCTNCKVEMFGSSKEALIETWNNQRDRISMLQYANLRTHFQKLIKEVLGLDYYNEGMDVYMCDEFSCRDIKQKLKKK